MRKVTWGMLGTATIAKRNTIAGMKKAPNCRLYAVAGRNPEKVDEYVKEYGSRFMVVMDPVLKDVGLADKILQPLNERNVDYFIFDELNDGANSKQIQQALELAKQGYVQGIIAVGGTKALNIASAVAALFNETFGIYDCLDGTVPTKEALPLICVPTTIRIPFLFNPVIPLIDARCNQIKLMKVH